MGVLVCIMALYGLIGKKMIENSHFQYINHLLSENFVKRIFSKMIFLAFLTIQTKKKGLALTKKHMKLYKSSKKLRIWDLFYDPLLDFSA